MELDEIELCVERLSGASPTDDGEEGFVGYLYDDADPKRVKTPVKAPQGNATIGFGENVQAGWTRDFAKRVLRLRVQDLAAAMAPYSWWSKCNAVRRSVLLDIAYNDGFGGLLHFHKMLTDIDATDWAAAKTECMVVNPQLKKRYGHLGDLLLTGTV